MAASIPTTAQNAAALDHFIYLPVSQDMIAYLAHKASQVIRCEGQSAASKRLPPTPPTTPPQHSSEAQIPTLEQFITNLVDRSHVQVPTLMTSLVFLGRLQQRLPPVAKGMKCTGHRIFLASLILAAKNLNDSSPKNKHWARYTTVAGFDNFGFSLTEVNLMEKQLLGLLEWDLRVTEEDLYHHFEPFLAPIRSWQAHQAEKQRLREEMAALEQQKLALAAEQQRRAAAEAAKYHESPRSYAGSYSSHHAAYYASSSRGSSRAPSRTPSLSPPTRSISSASDASATSYDSPRSPASFTSVAGGPMYEEPAVYIQRSDTQSSAALSQIHKPLPALHYAHDLSLEQPAKKQKSNNIFSRFLPTMSRPQHPAGSIHGY
jgi:hypothetical protein